MTTQRAGRRGKRTLGATSRIRALLAMGLSDRQVARITGFSELTVAQVRAATASGGRS